MLYVFGKRRRLSPTRQKENGCTVLHPTGRRSKAPKWGLIAGLIVVVVAICGEPQRANFFIGGDYDEKTKIGVPFDLENILESRVPLLTLPEGISNFDRQVGSQLSASSFGLFSAEINKPPNDNCESASGNSGNSRGNPVETFSDLPERDKGYVVCGAFFVAALIFIAIIYIRRQNF